VLSTGGRVGQKSPNYPAAWTADSRAVVFRSYRDGQWRAFKQSLDEDTAESIVTGPGRDVVDARVSPDGAWVFYVALPREASSSPQPEITS
jgi:Tol biopolymer transport system component